MNIRNPTQVTGVVRLGAGVLLLLGWFFAGSQGVRAQDGQVRRVLIVNEAGVAYPAINTINQSIRKELEKSPSKLEIYDEYLETLLFPDPAAQQAIRGFILHKYQNRKPDVIITVGPSALRFMQEDLPPGSVVLNREPSFWELYKRYAVSGTLVVLLQTLVILALLWQRARRRKSDLELVASNERLRFALKRLRESEERFRLVADEAPVMIWMSGTDKLCTFFNQGWLDFTGRSASEEAGNGWAKGVHADDLESCLKTYEEAFDAREPFEIEYRLRRRDGEYRWIVDLGVPRIHADGSFAGYIGSCADITERKLAEEALSSVSRRLIEAHEEERTWIARELHDDVSQRLAVLSLNLETLGEEVPELAGEALERLSDGVRDLCSDVHTLSHRLHSSKLEYLGLTVAVTAFCREFAHLNGVQIDLQCDDVPKTVPVEISLCLFRVLQEALQNANHHSGSRRYQVTVRYVGDDISLTVSDSGIGFDLQQAMRGRGLGLISMQERLKLVHGKLSIEPGTPSGTVVRAGVPMPPRSRSAVAGI